MTSRLDETRSVARRDAVVNVPAQSFVLADAIPEDVTVELGRLVPLIGRFLPFLWVRGETGALSRFERRARDDDAVRALTGVETAGTSRLYRVEWNLTSTPLGEAIAASQVVVRRVESGVDEWHVHLLSLEPRSLATFGEQCEHRGVPLTVDRLSPARSPDDAPVFDLTPSQAEALRVAQQAGYFDVPRGATLDELGEELGITRQAVSLRLRRGIRRLVEVALLGMAYPARPRTNEH